MSLKTGVNLNVSNEDYHGDTTHLSSSALKMILKDGPEEFHKRYILGEKKQMSNQAALDFGTAAHLMLLEPHLFSTETATFEGPIKRGKLWDAFKAENSGKLLLSTNEVDRLMILKSAFENHPDGPSLLSGCAFEYTMCAEIKGLKLKARADAININSGYIADVKTTGYAGDLESFKTTLEGLYYDLSGALYCLIAEEIYGKPFTFYYIVLSKATDQCTIFKTSTNTHIAGTTKLFAAIEKYKKCLLTNDWSNDILDSEDDDNSIKEI